MKKSILATLPIAAAVVLGAGAVVSNTSAIEPSDPICSTNVKDYVSFANAISSKCPTITLNGEITLNTTPTINYTTTIELGGHTLNGGSNTALKLDGASANVAIQGTGKVTSVNGSDGTITIKNGASLSVNSGATIENTYVSEDYSGDGIAITNSSSILIVNDGAAIISKEHGISLEESAKLTVNGGSVKSDETAITSDGEASTIDIKGGSIYGKYQGIMVYADEDSMANTLNISGGSIESEGNGVSFITLGNLTMTGGTVKGSMAGIEVGYGAVADIRGGQIIGDGSIYPEDDEAGVGVMVFDESERPASKVTISAPTVINATNQNPVLTMSEEGTPDTSNAGNKIIINAGVAFIGTRPAAAYLAPGLVVGPNGVVMTTAEAGAMAGATENPENPNTADHIAVYVTIAAVALLGLGATALIARKANR